MNTDEQLDAVTAGSSRECSKTVRTYILDGQQIDVDLCWRGTDEEADVDRFYDIYDQEGTLLNCGEPWHDDGDGPPSQAEVARLIASRPQRLHAGEGS
mgnify:FL=1